MFFPIHIILLSISILFLVAQNFIWNTSILAVGILASVMALFSVFIDPTLLLLP